MIFVIDAVDSFVPYIALFFFFVFFIYVTVILRPKARFVFCKTKGNNKKIKRKQKSCFFLKEGSFEWEMFYLII